MRVARVYTNATCNQCCGFCHTRRSHEDRRLVAPAAVRARIDADVTAGGELVLTGGEPTMRRDLPALVAHGKRRGATRVILETNAALITPALARALATAGLDLARVHLPAWGERCDAITRDPGGFVATLRGARALADAGVARDEL
ncbi:MAG: radical SAM protein, partial [Myxococcales bacterium]|nr:radical SAM protein [Myxococcales bacterium]